LLCLSELSSLVKVKVFPHSLPCVGHGADPGVQAVSPQVILSHSPSRRLPLPSARPALTFPAHRPVPIYTAWWQRQMQVNSLPKAVTWKRTGRESNPRACGSRANALPLCRHSTTPTPTLTRTYILADTSDTRDFLKLFLWQAERHADILTTILARMSARVSVSMSASASWNAGFTTRRPLTKSVGFAKSLSHRLRPVCVYTTGCPRLS